ncbi:MAG: aminoacyl-tRNA hydrolase [Kiritimatiellae bacterium]|nr:aminoacyl-tRNA hydrolase [Kiritimatiellia bacterium]
MIWVLGLGNPGEKYRLTRHNAGYMVLDSLAERRQVRFGRSWFFRARLGLARESGMLLVKPETFMNRSGLTAKRLHRWRRLPLEGLVVVVDDMSLPQGTVRVRSQGSAGGHNGLKSLIAALGTERFVRVRVGIGPAPGEGSVVDYVLSGFSESEWPTVEEGIKRAAEAVEFIEDHGAEKAMNRFN